MAIDPQLLWIGGAVLAAIVVIALIAAARRSRTARLREHFGPEYDHVVHETRSRTRAEEALIARAEEAKTIDIRPLAAAEAERYRAEWDRIEKDFVEKPTIAVSEADELVASIMRAQGYPIADFEKHAELLSVKHPRVVDHYRSGHDAILSHSPGATSTEDLRQAMLHYRALVYELLGPTDVVRDVPVQHEVAVDRAAEPRGRAGTEEDERLRR